MIVKPLKGLFVTFAVMATALVAVSAVITPANAAEKLWKKKYNYENNDGISQIYNFGEHTCGVQDDVLWCWGSNGNYRLGRYLDFASDRQHTRTSPRFVRTHTYVNADEGANMQLCTNSDSQTACTSNSTTFENSGTKGIVAMGGLYTTCVIQGSSPTAIAGELFCMGYNKSGQVGNNAIGSNVNDGVMIPTKVVIGDGFTNTNVISVDGGTNFTCAIEGATSSATDGILYCWGEDGSKQLGQTVGAGDSATPKKVDAGGSFANTAVSGLSSGFTHSCAIEGAKVFCWGNNGGTVGTNQGEEIFPPSLTATYPGLITNGGEGRVGQPGSTPTLATPTAVQSGDGFTNTNVTKVSAGYRHSCAIESGAVYCWGNNDSGQLGDGSTTASSAPRKVLTTDNFANVNVSNVVAGDHFTCALEDGSVFCWGDQQLGRLGFSSQLVPQANGPAAMTSPVRVLDGAIPGGNTGITNLATGSGAHSCAVKDAKAYCWGPGKRWGTLSDGSVGPEVWSGIVNGWSTNAPQPREVQWGPANPVDPNDPGLPAGAPSNVIAKAGWNKVDVTWTEPVDVGSYPITHYFVHASPGGRLCISRLTDKVLESCSFTNLTPGTLYKFTVKALTGAGWGPRSDLSNATSPFNLRITSYDRRALGLLQGQGSDATFKGAAPGYSANTKIVPWIKIGNGAWVANSNSDLKVDTSGSFNWKRRFVKNLNSQEITVKFSIDGNFSNTTVVGSVKTNRGLFSAESAESDLGGMPESGAPQTDIQFGFDEGEDITTGLPVQLDGTYLKPESSVTAELVRVKPTPNLTTTLWSSSEAPSRSIAPVIQEIAGTVNSPIATTLAFTPTGFAPTVYSTANLPAGLAINPSTGVISGTPSAASTVQVIVTATAGADTATAKVSFNIAGTTSLAPAFQTVNGVVGTALSTASLAQTGLQGAVTFSALNTLPAGLTLDTSTGEITGVPTVDADARVVIRGTGATSGTADSVVSFKIVFTTASAIVDENGDVYTTLELPSNLGAGEYKIVFRGTKPDGSAIEEINYFNLSEPLPSWMFTESTPNLDPNPRVLMVVDSTPKPGGPLVHAITAVTPDRLVDTRESSFVEAGGVLEVQVTGRGGVPVGATSAVLNVTATDHFGDGGYLTVYACEATRRETSNLNVDHGGTVANAVTVELGTSGKVCVYTFNRTHIVVDVTGYADSSSSLRYSSVTPVRVIDTRQPTSATSRLTAGQTVELAMPSSVPSSAEAVALNVTLVSTDGYGWAAVYPCGLPRPNTSTVNTTISATVAGSALALLGSNDKVCVYTSVGTDLLVDIFGWYGSEAEAELQSHDAQRLLDTRRAIVISTITENGESIEVADDQSYIFNTPVPAGTVSGVSTDVGYAGEASAVVANITVTAPEAEGYLTVYDCQSKMPIVSSLNFKAGEIRANQIVIPTTTDSLCIYNSVAAHIILDVVGRYLVGGPALY
jgi:alpha-tubulin suppressor-like RCC1 family protein